MVEIEWSPIAENDLNEIIDYIAQDSLEYALSFYDSLLLTIILEIRFLELS